MVEIGPVKKLLAHLWIIFYCVNARPVDIFVVIVIVICIDVAIFSKAWESLTIALLTPDRFLRVLFSRHDLYRG